MEAPEGPGRTGLEPVTRCPWSNAARHGLMFEACSFSRKARHNPQAGGSVALGGFSRGYACESA